MSDTEQATLMPSGSHTVHETYNSALQHDIAKIPADAWCVSVVNDEMYGISGMTDEQFPSLGPPRDLFEEFKDTRASLEDDGMDRVDAHNEAWDVTDFEATYREHLEQHWTRDDSPVREACETILGELPDRPVAVVCYEGTEKHCHRHVLQAFLKEKHDSS